METRVACVGTFDEEAFDQRDDDQVTNASGGGLGESVSFGRFSADSCSWVKRSSFNHNQYLEEVETCSTPGSVRQKKAYFEAYYKAIAKRKALEKALAEENLRGQNFENLDSGVQENEQQQQSSPAINTSDVFAVEQQQQQISPPIDTSEVSAVEHQQQQFSPTIYNSHNLALNKSSVFMEESTVDAGCPREKLSLESPRQVNGENPHVPIAEGLYSESEDLNLESQNPSSEGAVHQESNSESAEEILHSVSESCKAENELVPSIKEHKAEDTFLVSSTDELAEKDAHSFEGEQDSVAQFDGSVHADKVDVKSADRLAEDGLPRPKSPTSFNLMDTLPQSFNKHIDLDGNELTMVSAPKQLSQSVDQTRKGKCSSSTVNTSNAAAEISDEHHGIVQKRQGIRGVVEMRNHHKSINSGNSRTNITVPHPFALATDKRASMVGHLPEQDVAKATHKPARIRSSLSPLVVKRVQSPAKSEKKPSAHKPSTEENKKKQEKCEQQSETQNESKQDDVTQSAIALPGLTKTGGKLIGNQLKYNANAFSFKSDERAEKRKEFNSRLEARLTAKEAEKYQAEAKTQEEAVEEIKQLRKSLNFKATPMPNFYQESTQTKMDVKKAGIPTTRAKSPKLGRRSNSSPVNTALNSANPCLGSTTKQGKHICPVPQKQTNSAETSSDDAHVSKTVSSASNKATKKICKTKLAAENSSIQLCSRQTTNLSDPHKVEEVGTFGLLDCPTSKIFDDKSNTAVVDTDANDTNQCKDGHSVENSSDDKKYDDVKRIDHSSNKPSGLEGLDTRLQRIPNTMPNTREENDAATTMQCSSASEKEKPRKHTCHQNGVSVEKLDRAMISRKDYTRIAASSANSSKRPTKRGSSKDSTQTSDK